MNGRLKILPVKLNLSLWYFITSKVKAVDVDSGVNAKVTYAISTLTDPEFIPMFSIEPNTGWLKLERELDFENHKEASRNNNGIIRRYNTSFFHPRLNKLYLPTYPVIQNRMSTTRLGIDFSFEETLDFEKSTYRIQ